MKSPSSVASAATRISALFVLIFGSLSAHAQTAVFINEIHYDNVGSDTGEAIEIAGPAGTDLTGWSIVRYNGNSGAAYGTDVLSGTISNLGAGVGVVFVTYPSNGLQNGAPDGVALVDDMGSVVQFLSYEGSFTAVGGPADGLTSTDIGVSEASSTPVGSSLQLTGSGAFYEDFAWGPPAASTFGAENIGQTFDQTGAPDDNLWINEIHYDNAGSDTGEAIELAGEAGTNLNGWSIVRYNGSNGLVYGTTDLSGSLDDQCGGFGFFVDSYPSNGLQNGSPDGVALVDPDGNVIEFLSYEGNFTAANGPAAGLTSTDIGVSEASNTPVGDSLQLAGDGTNSGDFTWVPSATSTFGSANNDQTFAGQDCSGGPSGDLWVNEFHYDNAGSDIGEAIELAGPAGTSLDGWTLLRYNGNGGGVYGTTALSGVLEDQCVGYGFVVDSYPSNGLQNGSPDGIALVDPAGVVVEFLSYEGSFTATNGPAAGLTSTDIGVAESSGTPVGSSLQLSGDGTAAADFSWVPEAASTFGAANNDQTFGGESCASGPAEPTPIPVIQGSGDSSPLVGETVLVDAVVTGDFQDGGAGVNGDLNGFYLQDETGDGDPATSDGIFVFDGFSPDVDVAPGDRVQVVGIVAEFFGETQINVTSGSVSVTGTGSVAPTPIGLPIADTRTNSRGELIADLENVEGMLITVPQTLTVTELFQLDRFGEMVLAQGGRFEQFTQSNVPDPTGFALHVEDLAGRSLILDDGQTVQNPDPIRYPPPGLTTANAVRMGDTVSGLTGNIRYSRGSGGSGDEAYRLEPVMTPTFAPLNIRPEAPADVGGRLRIASVNVLNFFNDLDDGTGECFAGGAPTRCRGADSVEEFDRQAEKLTTALSALDADVLGLVELENDYFDGEESSIAELVGRLNGVDGACAGGYDYVRPGDTVGDDAIAVGLVYCVSKVTPAFDTTVEILEDDDLADLGLTGPIFNGRSTNRAPLAASFDESASGERFTVVVNHFKSKGASELDDTGSPCLADPASDPDCDQGDGAGYWNERRAEASRALVAWLATDPTGSGEDDVIILGDLNAYLMESPIMELSNAGFVNLVQPGDYSFVFDGQIGTLDYALVSSGLETGVAGVDEWHINADEADALDYNLDFGRNPALFDGSSPARASDHDPILFGLDLPDTTAPVIACNAPPSLTTRDRGATITATAVDALDDSPAVAISNVRCLREFRGRTGRSFCIASASGDTLEVRLPGRPGSRIEWDVTATDDAGNTAEAACSVNVVRP
ncbi:MAG: ExeM/NucH family extracellular endonuclease [Woeseiaceae bacterium]|nr:ExeM/NucH family extracellular endonuclease [Woeseiaceae bacterium]